MNGISKPIEKVTDTVKETVNAVTDLDDIVNKVIRGDFGNGADRLNKLTEAACIQPCCYFFIVRMHVTELERSGNEVALRTRYI